MVNEIELLRASMNNFARQNKIPFRGGDRLMLLSKTQNITIIHIWLKLWGFSEIHKLPSWLFRPRIDVPAEPPLIDPGTTHIEQVQAKFSIPIIEKGTIWYIR